MRMLRRSFVMALLCVIAIPSVTFAQGGVADVASKVLAMKQDNHNAMLDVDFVKNDAVLPALIQASAKINVLPMSDPRWMRCKGMLNMANSKLDEAMALIHGPTVPGQPSCCESLETLVENLILQAGQTTNAGTKMQKWQFALTACNQWKDQNSKAMRLTKEAWDICDNIILILQ